ncbi:hypothetical protein FBU31_000912 [Coemansia sp. 'formosensis']|nr:hypothetical protein FBU31_000912 [Coemansia sp. 'formosensis']
MSPEQRASIVFQLLQDSSKKDYMGGKTSLLDHALQAAQLAKNLGADEETIMAALLLDIGRLCPSKEQRSNLGDDIKFSYQIPDRAGNTPRTDYYEIGAKYLRGLGFSKKTCKLIESRDLAIRDFPVHIPSFAMPIIGDTIQVIWRGFPSPSPADLERFENAMKTPVLEPASLDSYREMAIRNLKLEN